MTIPAVTMTPVEQVVVGQHIWAQGLRWRVLAPVNHQSLIHAVPDPASTAITTPSGLVFVAGGLVPVEVR